MRSEGVLEAWWYLFFGLATVQIIVDLFKSSEIGDII